MAVTWITGDDLDDPTNPDAAEAALAASTLLYQLSGRKYGGSYEVVEFYEPPSECSGIDMSRYFELAQARAHHRLGCDYHRRHRLQLRRTPVHTVSEVVVNWETEHRVVDSDEYQVVDRKWLRPTIDATWTPCSNLQVTYTGGARVPAAGVRAARILGNELLKARCGDDSCALPDRVTSISRQGVTFTVLDPQDFLKEGRTGLYEVDLFLGATNPDGARKRSRVFSPDLPRASRVS